MDKELEKRIAQVNEEALAESSQEPAEGQEQVRPRDYYQMQQNAAYTASQKPTVYGSPAQMVTIVKQMVEDFKQTDYNINRNQYNHLQEYEAYDTAENLRQGYLVNEFFPLVESLVEIYGTDALLNSPRALATLDEVAITPNGAGDGFTKGYLMQMHKGQQAQAPSESDIEVAYGVEKAQRLADQGNVRGGVNLAKQLKDRVDKGELSASDKDYKILAKGAAYGN